MLRSLKATIGYKLNSLDGEIGSCKDFIFDSSKWAVRYMVADTGNWLPGRKVLISPVSLGKPKWEESLFPVSLSKNKIESAPGLDQDAPVSRQYEIQFHRHYDWPYYWRGFNLWGERSTPWISQDEKRIHEVDVEDEEHDPNLRSMEEIRNYRVLAKDEKSGTIHDFIVNDKDWSIQYLVVDTGSWLSGKKVLIGPGYVSKIDYFRNAVCLSVDSNALEDFPEYDSSRPINSKIEEVKYDFKGRPYLMH